MPLDIDFVREKFKKPFVIGVGGVATSGKDTFYSLLQDYLDKYNIETRRFALADELKLEIDPYLTSQFGISAFTTDREEKRLIRPCLVAHGFVRRQQSKGRYWTSRIEGPLEDAMSKGIIPVVTDIRYAEFEEDELAWLRKFQGKLVHITRYTEIQTTTVEGHIVRTPVSAPNEDERKNDPKLRDGADFRIEWETEKSVNLLVPHIESFIKNL